ncbi:hypothetical protein ACFLZG_03705 [Thermodesulfobacteriota bacterium]
MPRIISNATPIIYLTKAGQLRLLHDLFDSTLIPEAVYREVVVVGKNKGEKDAFIIDDIVRNGWIEVKKIKKEYSTELSIHPGELEVISLAREEGVNTVLMDYVKARTVAEMAGLNPKGTLWLLLQAIEKNILNFQAFLVTLEDIVRSGFYLKEDVILKSVHKAKELSG